MYSRQQFYIEDYFMPAIMKISDCIISPLSLHTLRILRTIKLYGSHLILQCNLYSLENISNSWS